MSDHEKRIEVLEDAVASVYRGILAFLFGLFLVFSVWDCRWQNGMTDRKPPLYVDRISYEDWKAKQ
jgi:hypothetical protein